MDLLNNFAEVMKLEMFEGRDRSEPKQASSILFRFPISLGICNTFLL